MALGLLIPGVCIIDVSSRSSAVVRYGRPDPLGATPDADGTNFSVFSRIATGIDLCLFDEAGQESRIALPEVTGSVWHGHVPGVSPGQHYGYRVHGPWEPNAGRRCNPHKLLIDPYARAIDGDVRPDGANHDHVAGSPTIMDEEDSAPDVPRSIVVHSDFDWHGDSAPHIPARDRIFYETHVRGISMRHPEVPDELRGTYAGLAHPAVIEHLVSLGVTSVELQPVHHFIHPGFLLEQGLRNYWGYDSLGYFAPHSEYASSTTPGGQVDEFKAMVRALHAAGLEVILDVVYNHTGEGNHRGPSLAFRGLDDGAYYRHRPGDASKYEDVTGTGNTLDSREPFVLRLIADSLRYWINEMHVDGFRFDLAVALAREDHHFDLGSGFFDVITQDPTIRNAALIAEPWDIGDGGYRVGDFPALFAEWNGRYRDDVRDLWRGEPDMLHALGRRLSGSSDLYRDEGRKPAASVNFITAHDGFTLRDLVSYDRKHNLANGEDDGDGETHNRSWNCGVEGPTEDSAVLSLRRRQERNLLTTLLLSQGVPMLLGGDEMGRTQDGNNNAYCQDNELTWYDWVGMDEELLAFTRGLIALRRDHPVFRRRRWYQEGVPDDAPTEVARDIEWCGLDGARLRDDEWHIDGPGAIGVYLSGEHLVDDDGRALSDDSFYVAINATPDPLSFAPPEQWLGAAWSCILDTAADDPFRPATGPAAAVTGELRLPPHALAIVEAAPNLSPAPERIAREASLG